MYFKRNLNEYSTSIYILRMIYPVFVDVHTGRKKILPRITRFHIDIILFLFSINIELVHGKVFFQNVAQKNQWQYVLQKI